MDRQGQGIIHSNEPCQAVFFDPKGLKPLTLLRNRRDKAKLRREHLNSDPTLAIGEFIRGRYTLDQTLGEIVDRTGLMVQTGGGVRSADDVQRLLDAGATRVVVGSPAVREPETVVGFLDRFGPAGSWSSDLLICSRTLSSACSTP